MRQLLQVFNAIGYSGNFISGSWKPLPTTPVTLNFNSEGPEKCYKVMNFTFDLKHGSPNCITSSSVPLPIHWAKNRTIFTDYNSAAPVITTTSVILSSDKVRVETLWYRLTQIGLEHGRQMDVMSFVNHSRYSETVFTKCLGD